MSVELADPFKSFFTIYSFIKQTVTWIIHKNNQQINQ